MAREDIAARVGELLADYLKERDLDIYRITYRKEGPGWILRVYLDKPADSENEYVSIAECEEVTSYLSELLDELELIDRSYNLEVSSPGLDRELIHEADFVRFAGREVEVRTYEAVNGTKSLEGTLKGKTDGKVIIEVSGEILEIPSDKISKINLAVVF